MFTHHPQLPLTKDPRDGDPFIVALHKKAWEKGWKLVYQLEKGEEGHPHFQGYLERGSCYILEDPDIGKKAFPMVHWERRKKKPQACIDYCSKEDGRLAGPWCLVFKVKRPLDALTHEQVMTRKWQAEMKQILDGPVHPRKIYWRWERVGNTGKSAFARYWAVRYPGDSILVAGKAEDVKCAIKKVIEAHNGNYEHAPRVVFFDIPRGGLKNLDYTGIEQVKNGHFFCGKYESGEVVFHQPHVVIFANDEPNKGELSDDRWDIERITSEACVLPVGGPLQGGGRNDGPDPGPWFRPDQVQAAIAGIEALHTSGAFQN